MDGKPAGVAAICAVASVMGCGRAALLEWTVESSSSGAGGTGGSSTSTSGTGGTAGTGGTGGTTGSLCLALEVVGPPIAVPSPPWGHEQRPQLVAASTAGDLVTLLFEWLPVESPGPVPTEVRHLSFDAWGDWPPSELSQSFLASNQGGHSFAAANSLGIDVAVLYTQGTPNAPMGVSFTDEVVPWTNGAGSQIEIDPQANGALFAAYVEGQPHLVGTQRPGPFPGSHQLDISWVHTAAGQIYVEGPHVLGCVDTPVVADALRLPSGWLVARAMSPAPCSGSQPPQPPVDLSFSHYQEGGVLFNTNQLPGTDPITWIGLASRFAGTWVAYRRSPGNAVGAIEAFWVDEEGWQVSDPTTLVGPGSEPRWLAIDRLGDGLAIVWIDTSVNGPPFVELATFGLTGNHLAQASVPVEGWGAGGVPAIIGAPDGRSVLIAWTRQLGDGIPDEMMMLRYDCVDK
jgi:hypothetical protein